MIKKICLLFLIVCLSACSSTSNPPLKSGEVVPLTKFRLLNGNYLFTDEFKGRQLAILFWAEWCSKSVKELKNFEHLAKKVNSKYVTFVAANVDDFKQLEKVEQRISNLNIRAARVAFSGNEGLDEAFIQFRGDGIPLVFLVNELGRVAVSASRVSELESFLLR